jgi:hypothetical protein
VREEGYKKNDARDIMGLIYRYVLYRSNQGLEIRDEYKTYILYRDKTRQDKVSSYKVRVEGCRGDDI